ncbi:hypothetical protein GCM10010082_19400 [Kushneria pakistanensis]|uniref:Uncharacterized protein n=1 Tax=Kushneria pakistanensis TaxID=1508770 RepID=A0ABQ3FIY4_9GAMM|nr:hypothetical protein [Kushneria pakistanensis]GHC26355.1 hypothetical protein GCM10010082_19400 [Kushneria pakistanensis]
MQGDQASGLRQWSQRGAASNAPSSTELVVMVPPREEGDAEVLSLQLAQRLALPEGAQRWQPRTLVLSEPLPDVVSASPWWVLHLPEVQARSASLLASALRTLHHAGMPQTVLLAAPDHLAVSGLIRAAHAHLGVALLQEVTAWQQAVMARLSSG